MPQHEHVSAASRTGPGADGVNARGAYARLATASALGGRHHRHPVGALQHALRRRADAQVSEHVERAQRTPSQIIGGGLGGGLGASGFGGGALVAIQGAALGGPGALVVGSIAFPPIGVFITAMVFGGLTVGSIIALIVKLWKDNQSQALIYLERILDGVGKLNEANLSFMKYMDKSKVSMSEILSNVNTMRTSIAHPTPRQRRQYAQKCEQAITSTTCLIECIDKLVQIDLKELSNLSGSNFLTERDNSAPISDAHSLTF